MGLPMPGLVGVGEPGYNPAAQKTRTEKRISLEQRTIEASGLEDVFAVSRTTLAEQYVQTGGRAYLESSSDMVVRGEEGQRW